MISISTRAKTTLWTVLSAVFLVGIGAAVLFALMRPVPVYTVTFLCDNRVIAEEKVRQAESATPPNEFGVPEGKVFSGWDAAFDNIKADIVIRAKLVSTDDINLFTLGSASCKKGEEVCIPLRLQGNVNLAGFELTILYPTDELEFKDFENLDKDMFANYLPETGEIKIAFASGNNVDGAIDICDLLFEAKGKTGSSSIVVSNILASQLHGDEIRKAIAGSVPATVYFY